MRELLPEIVILALNVDRVEKELSFLQAHGFNPKHVLGVYKEVAEDSYLIPIKGTEEFNRLMTIAAQHNQECILYSNEDRETFLYYVNGDIVPIGKLTQVTREEAASSSENYTYDPEAKTYWRTTK